MDGIGDIYHIKRTGVAQSTRETTAGRRLNPARGIFAACDCGLVSAASIGGHRRVRR